MVKKRLKVLFVTPLRGGLGNWSRCLIEEMDKLADVTLLTYKRKREADDKVPFTKINEEHILEAINPDRPHHIIEYNNKASLDKVIELTEKIKPDIVHLNLWAGKQILWFVNDYSKYLKQNKIPIFMTIHDVYPQASKDISEQKEFIDIWENGDMIVVLNKDEQAKLNKLNIKTPTDVIPHGVYHFQNQDRVNKKDARKIVSKKLGIKIRDKEEVILFFGYIRDYKGLMYLIESAPKVLESFPDTLFLAVGTMELAENPEKYQKRIDELNLSKRFIIYPKYINSPYLYEAFYKACDLNVLPYIGVSASGALFSSIGMKRPVIISKIGSFLEKLNKEDIINTVKPESTELLTKEIIKVLKNKTAADKKALKAYKITERDYNWTKIVKSLQIKT